MKKIDAGTLAILFFLLTLFIPFIPYEHCWAEQNDVQINLDGNILDTNVPPVLINGQIYLPARDIVEALGGRITWFPALKLLNLYLGSREVSLVIDIPEAEVNKEKIPLENSPTIVDNRVMIPLEVVRLLTGVEAEEEKSSQEIKITSQKPMVTAIRHYIHPDKTRIVIDVSKKSPYQVFTLTDPDRIVIDVEASLSQLSEEQKEIQLEDLLVRRVRMGQFTQDTVRIVMDLKEKYEFQAFDLSSPDRIVVDIFTPQSQLDITTKTEVSEKAETEKVKQPVIVIDPGHGGSQPGAIGPSGLKEKEVALDIALRLRNKLQNDGFTVYLTREKDIEVPLENRPLMAVQKEATAFISIHTNSVIQKGSSTARGIETYVLNSRYIGASAKDVADRENRASQFYHYEDDILNQIIADLEESASISFSLDFADIVQKRLVQHTGLDNRGVKQAPFIVLKGLNMAGVLIEVGFISNPNEEKLLKTPEFREKVAQALSEAVKEYVSNIPENI
ncbi:MAG: N-acetylmuramoyl-L-alanine amidase [Atribacterota bacterium]|nr:N-acetylmuramoyl-L-alanine amidase [Atribacterota bacterium]MDD5496824.1 N-acetylmuramoyl-L-alanine amidase [Atribacterota bacterium]